MTQEQPQKQQQGLTLVLMRNAFYRDYYRRAVFALTVIVFVNIALLSAIVHRYFNPPAPQYFPTTASGKIIKFHPLSDPLVSDNYVLQWTANAVQKAFGLDFVHWRSQLQEASNNFTPSGWVWFTNALQKSGNLDSLVKMKMVSDAAVTGAPQMQYQGVLDGIYVWKIQLPILITFSNIEKSIPLPLKITLIVERVPVQDNPNQIAINQFLPVAQSSQ